MEERVRSNKRIFPKRSKNRAWELDALRGLAILGVIWDHVMFDLAYMFYYEWQYLGAEGLLKAGEFARTYHEGFLRVLGWPVFVFIFFFVSGICTTFSRNNFFRGLKLALAAVLVSVVTYLIDEYMGMSGSFILFGVLHCLATCILLYSLIEWILKLTASKSKYYRYIKVGVYFALAVALLIVNYTQNVTLYDVNTYKATVQSNWDFAGMFVFTRDWWTADYFPLLPFFAFFLLGAGVSPLAYPKKESLLPKLDGKWNKFLTIPGRYSLYIYLALQVIAVVVLCLITWIATGTIPFI